jgi:hypothetical protein
MIENCSLQIRHWEYSFFMGGLEEVWGPETTPGCLSGIMSWLLAGKTRLLEVDTGVEEADENLPVSKSFSR